jgi:hypothetical protein
MRLVWLVLASAVPCGCMARIEFEIDHELEHERTAHYNDPVVAAKREYRIAAHEQEMADACESGRASAQREIESDDYLSLGHFMQQHCQNEFEWVMLQDYGVLVSTSDCLVSSWSLVHSQCHDELIEAEIARRHGADAIQRAAAKAGCD